MRKVEKNYCALLNNLLKPNKRIARHVQQQQCNKLCTQCGWLI